jgi:GNAT superfamily N-acetyltransferase
MSAAFRDIASSVSAQVTRRWQAIDPLLPVPGTPPPGCGPGLIVAGADRQPTAVGTCEHWEGTPGTLEMAWGAARRFQLTARIAGPGPDVADSLDQLLSLWRDHLARVPGADGEDTAAVVTWPSRDIHGIGTLLRHGFAPLTVIAARATGRYRAGTADQDLRIRRAWPADIDAVARLGLEVVQFDAHFGCVIERPGVADAVRRETAGSLADPEGWTWLAERDGTPIGMLYAEPPESAGWIAPMVRSAPVAYITLMAVQPGERGRGVGAALVAQVHTEIAAAGVAVTLLHYEQLNPLSVPFWSQQGYRPLWTVWEARPARAIR